MNHTESMKKYLQYLEAADYENLILLFSEDAIVHSPLYGKVAATKFYKDLLTEIKTEDVSIVYGSRLGHLALNLETLKSNNLCFLASIEEPRQ